MTNTEYNAIFADNDASVEARNESLERERQAGLVDETLTVDEIQNLLIEEMGETGSWRVSGDNGLYLKKEENYRELYFGTVDSADDVQAAFDSVVWE